jgi:hypothetical protein
MVGAIVFLLVLEQKIVKGLFEAYHGSSFLRRRQDTLQLAAGKNGEATAP